VAAEEGDSPRIKTLLSQGAIVNCENEKGWTPLIVAAFNQKLECVKVLVEYGGNVNHQSLNGTTVLMYAKTKVIETNDYEVLDFLLESGADINKRDFKNSWTVLQYIEGQALMEEYLISKGAIK
jgi:ankyrin repeat protein